METERKSVFGMVKFDFNYTLTGTETRDRPYSKTGARYTPAELKFSLTAATYDGTAPSYDDLKIDSVGLKGYLLKKDGTPGLQEVNETFYSYAKDRPAWVTEIIERTLHELQEGV